MQLHITVFLLLLMGLAEIRRSIWHLLLFHVGLHLSYCLILHWCSCMISIFILQVCEKLSKHLSKIDALHETVRVAANLSCMQECIPPADCTLESYCSNNECSKYIVPARALLLKLLRRRLKHSKPRLVIKVWRRRPLVLKLLNGNQKVLLLIFVWLKYCSASS